MGLRAPRRTVLAGLRAPHPDMRDDFYGAPPHALTMGEGIYARLRLRTIVYGASPQTPLEDFFGKKSPRPEKTKLHRFQAIK